MKTTRVIASILAWFNLVFWGFPVITSLLEMLVAPDGRKLVVVVMLAAIPLNSFAALQLHRSIRNPKITLNHQTPVGIRFVGFFALFIGVIMTACGLIVVQNAKELLPAWKDQIMANLKDAPASYSTISFIQSVGGFMAVAGLLIVLNVVLNIRLLRWYYLVNRSDVS